LDESSEGEHKAVVEEKSGRVSVELVAHGAVEREVFFDQGGRRLCGWRRKGLG